MEKNNKKLPYLAPELTTVEFAVELGNNATSVEVNPNYDEMAAYLTALGLTEQQQQAYYNNNMPSGNSGYFSGGGSGADGGGYFGGYF